MPASLRRLVGGRSKDVWDTLEHRIASNAPDQIFSGNVFLRTGRIRVQYVFGFSPEKVAFERNRQ